MPHLAATGGGVKRGVGPTEMVCAVIVWAVLDGKGVRGGLGVVTDPRPEHRSDTTDADLRKRDDAYLFGGRMASRFNIDAKRDCTALAPAEGESAVGALFVKQSCALIDAEHRRKIELKVNFFRKPGQSAFNPQMSTQLTQGQFESSARLEVFDSE